MKKFIITALFASLFISCGQVPYYIKEKPHKVTYEVMYPQGSRQFTINTKEGKARVSNYHSGFFHGGPMVYTLTDKTHAIFAYEEYPIIIISQE